MTNFNRDDIVQLKSGGPQMTVVGVLTEIESDTKFFAEKFDAEGRGFMAGDVICQWFDGNKQQTSAFSAGSLKKSTSHPT